MAEVAKPRPAHPQWHSSQAHTDPATPDSLLQMKRVLEGEKDKGVLGPEPLSVYFLSQRARYWLTSNLAIQY